MTAPVEAKKELSLKIDNYLRVVMLDPKMKDEVRKSLLALVDKACVAARQDIVGWIERNHLGKGFDGSDRWEQCAAEIIAHIRNGAKDE